MFGDQGQKTAARLLNRLLDRRGSLRRTKSCSAAVEFCLLYYGDINLVLVELVFYLHPIFANAIYILIKDVQFLRTQMLVTVSGEGGV